MTAQFGWLSAASDIPARWDLRLMGWEFATLAEQSAAPLLFDARPATQSCAWNDIANVALTVAVGVDGAEERAALLAAGFGEALPTNAAFAELAVRMSRLASGLGALPRHRRIGPVMLDLLHRDARAGGHWLALHPREFALLWRLADTPDKRVARESLLCDVWRRTHIPSTNSLEVHVSRLRAKLAAVQAGWLVETDPRSGYRLADVPHEPVWTAAAPMPTVAIP